MTVAGISIVMSAEEKTSVPENLKLKVSKEKIWKSEVVDDIRCDKDNLKCINFGQMVKYIYVSDREAVEQTLGEVLLDSTLLKNNINPDKKNLKETSRDYNAQNFQLDDKKTLSVIHVGVPFVKEKATGKWFYTQVATTTIDAFESQTQISFLDKIKGFLIGKALATTDTFYLDPGTGQTTVDGLLLHYDANGTSWNDLVTGQGTSAQPDTTQSYFMVIETDTTSWKNCWRSMFLFDTSSIPDGNIIESATLSLNGTSKFDSLSATPSVNVYSASPASNNTLTAADYSQVGSTEFATAISYNDWLTNGYNDFILNASGIASIDKGGISKFSIRSNYDANNSPPTWSSNSGSGIVGDYADYGSYPKLVVVHLAATIGYKDVDESFISQTTLRNDSNLKINLSASKTYVVEGLLFAKNTSGTSDLKIGFTVPSGAIMNIAYIANDPGASNNSSSGVLETSGSASSAIDLTTNDIEIIQISGTIKTSSTAGDLQLQWAQQNSSQNATTIKAGSFLKIMTEI